MSYVFRSPVRISNFFYFIKFLLRIEQFCGTIRMLVAWLSVLLWKIYLVILHSPFHPIFFFILEPTLWNTQVKLNKRVDSKLTPQEYLPMVVYIKHCRSMAHINERNLFESLGVPEYLHLLTLRISNDLPCKINGVRFVKNVQSNILCNVCVIDFFIWIESKSGNMFCFFSCNSWHSSHNLLRVG